MQKCLVDVVVISISSPLKIGIYKDLKLIESIEKSGVTSDELPKIFDTLLNEYEIKNIVYSNGPGSYMSIKLSYIFLKTLSIVKNITLLAVDGFYFNKNMAIKAIGNRFFVKENGKISLKESMEVGEFELPNLLDFSKFSSEIEPVYILDAV